MINCYTEPDFVLEFKVDRGLKCQGEDIGQGEGIIKTRVKNLLPLERGG